MAVVQRYCREPVEQKEDIELERHYADVIVKRYLEDTGDILDAYLVGRENNPFNRNRIL